MPILEPELLGYWVSVIADIVDLARYEASNRSAQMFRVKLGIILAPILCLGILDGIN